MKKKNCFLIAEIGLSHEGSAGIAKSYIDLASDLGFDAIKFQTHNADDESSKQESFRSKIFFKMKQDMIIGKEQVLVMRHGYF